VVGAVCADVDEGVHAAGGLSLAAHAWIGMWGVLTDYLTERLMGPKGNVLRIGQLLTRCCRVRDLGGADYLVLVYVIWGLYSLRSGLPVKLNRS
jgi:hypothetical protein